MPDETVDLQALIPDRECCCDKPDCPVRARVRHVLEVAGGIGSELLEQQQQLEAALATSKRQVLDLVEEQRSNLDQIRCCEEQFAKVRTESIQARDESQSLQVKLQETTSKLERAQAENEALQHSVDVLARHRSESENQLSSLDCLVRQVQELEEQNSQLLRDSKVCEMKLKRMVEQYESEKKHTDYLEGQLEKYLVDYDAELKRRLELTRWLRQNLDSQKLTDANLDGLTDRSRPSPSERVLKLVDTVNGLLAEIKLEQGALPSAIQPHLYTSIPSISHNRPIQSRSTRPNLDPIFPPLLPECAYSPECGPFDPFPPIRTGTAMRATIPVRKRASKIFSDRSLTNTSDLTDGSPARARDDTSSIQTAATSVQDEHSILQADLGWRCVPGESLIAKSRRESAAAVVANTRSRSSTAIYAALDEGELRYWEPPMPPGYADANTSGTASPESIDPCTPEPFLPTASGRACSSMGSGRMLSVSTMPSATLALEPGKDLLACGSSTMASSPARSSQAFLRKVLEQSGAGQPVSPAPGPLKRMKRMLTPLRVLSGTSPAPVILDLERPGGAATGV